MMLISMSIVVYLADGPMSATRASTVLTAFWVAAVASACEVGNLRRPVLEAANSRWEATKV